jgi:hypothetical protein
MVPPQWNPESPRLFPVAWALHYLYFGLADHEEGVPRLSVIGRNCAIRRLQSVI